MEQCISSLDDFLEVYSSKNIMLNEQTIIRISYDIVCGFSLLHEKPVALKDIKPENILINYNLLC